MSSDKLVCIRWQMGQALLPEHLQAQEESLLGEMRQRFQLGGIPEFGIGRLEWNDSLLSEGVVSLRILSLVLPSGELIDIPGNAKAQPFNMNIAGSTIVSVYLHVIGEEASNDDSSMTQLSQEDDIVERIVHTVELSSEQGHNMAIYSLKLAEFEKDGEGVWNLADSYVPPLIQIGTSPFLSHALDHVVQVVEAFHFKLEREIMTSYLSGESLFTAKQCLRGLYRLQHLFCNLHREVHYHPYCIYEELKMFYIDLCIYQNSTPENIEVFYSHEQLAECFDAIAGLLTRRIMEIKGQTPYKPFSKKEGIFTIAKLPKEVKKAKEVYLLLQKPTVTTVFSSEGLKLAAMSRIAMMHQMALQGIPYKKIDRPPFQHTFGAEVEFFLIIEGEEWDYALADNSLAFYDQESLGVFKAYIYWRQG